MVSFFKRLVCGWSAVLYVAIAWTEVGLFNNRFEVSFETKIGLAICFIVALLIFYRNLLSIFVCFLWAGIALSIAPLRFDHPMCQYVVLAQVDTSGHIVSDDMYKINTDIVKKIRGDGPQKMKDGTKMYIDYYLYSARFGVIIGLDGTLSQNWPEIGDQWLGIHGWFFGIRAAFEEFAFWSVNFTPIFILDAAWSAYKSRPNDYSNSTKPVRGFLLLIPFCIGLAPLFHR
jgi:hypothetical protein